MCRESPVIVSDVSPAPGWFAIVQLGVHVTVYPLQLKAIVELMDLSTTRGGATVETCRFCEVDLDAANRVKVVRCAHTHTHTHTHTQGDGPLV